MPFYLPFQLRQIGREELSLATKVSQARDSTTLDAAAVQVFGQRQELVSRLGPFRLDQAPWVKIAEGNQVLAEVYHGA